MRLSRTSVVFFCVLLLAAVLSASAARGQDVLTGDSEIGSLYAGILPQRTRALYDIAAVVGADAAAYSALEQMGRYSAGHFSGRGLAVKNLHNYGKLATVAMTALTPSLLSSHGGSDAPFPEETLDRLQAAFAAYDSTVRTEAALILPTFAARAPGQLELADLYYHGEAAYDFAHDFRIVAMLRNLPLDEELKKPLPAIPSLPAGIAALRGVSNPFISSSDYSFAMVFDDIRSSQRTAMREFAKALDYQDAVAQNIEMQNMATDSYGLLETGGDEADSMIIGDTFNNIALLEFAMEKESLSEESKETFHRALVLYKAAVNREAIEVSKGAIVGQRSLEYGSDAVDAASGFANGGISGIFQGVRSLGRIGGRAAADVENAKAGRRLTRMSQRNQLFYTLWEKTALRLGVDLPGEGEAVPGMTPEYETYALESASGSAVIVEPAADGAVYVETYEEPYVEQEYVEPQPVQTPGRFVRGLFGRF